jgi:hypothetical protein
MPEQGKVTRRAVIGTVASGVAFSSLRANGEENMHDKESHCHCGGKFNQTSAASKNARMQHLMQTHGKEEKGTALFLVPAPERGAMERKIIVLKDVEYREAVKRGQMCIAFKWIPSSVKSFDELKEAHDKRVADGFLGCGNCGPDADPGYCEDDCMCDVAYEDCYSDWAEVY